MTNYLDPVAVRRLKREQRVRGLAGLLGLLVLALLLLWMSIRVDRIDAYLSEMVVTARVYGLKRATLRDSSVVLHLVILPDSFEK